MTQTHHSGASIDRIRGFRTLHKSAKTKSVKTFQQCRMSSAAGRLPPSRSPDPKQAENVGSTCRGTAPPRAHKRMIGKYVLDVFGGPGFVAKASTNLVYVSTCVTPKFGPRYDVTKSLVLTRIRQDVAVPRRQCLHRSLAASCQPKIMTLVAHSRMAWTLADFCIFGSPWFLVGNVDKRELHRIAAKCVGMG